MIIAKSSSDFICDVSPVIARHLRALYRTAGDDAERLAQDFLKTSRNPQYQTWAKSYVRFGHLHCWKANAARMISSRCEDLMLSGGGALDIKCALNSEAAIYDEARSIFKQFAAKGVSQ
ncbi:hypothetical protein [Terasakiella sp. SH-1]|uniref:hypothetical protein n=1 Tax=Terasakiella sp. SH-1 TaxID=2560057 RepID=UPI0010732A55|nr:hypothetical protein [Terasakiella sp. SH-1]